MRYKADSRAHAPTDGPMGFRTDVQTGQADRRRVKIFDMDTVVLSGISFTLSINIEYWKIEFFTAQTVINVIVTHPS